MTSSTQSTQIDNNSRKLLLFFVLTFSFSWSIWFLAPLISLGDPLLFSGICTIGVFGPSISATFIVSRKKSHSEDNLKKKKWITFSIIFIVSFFTNLSTVILIPSALYVPIIFIFLITSIIAAFLISGMFSSNQGRSELLRSIKGVKGNNIFLLIAFLLPLLVNIGGALIFIILGGIIIANIDLFMVLLSLTFTYLLCFFFGGPLNEEIGWRGFATPRLQEKYNPLITGLIIGIIWSVWHGPLHFNGAYGDGLLGFLMRPIVNIPLGIIFTWYYNKSQGNLLGAIILHTSGNVFTLVIIFSPEIFIFTTLIYIIFSLFIIVQGKMWKKLPIEQIQRNFKINNK